MYFYLLFKCQLIASNISIINRTIVNRKFREKKNKSIKIKNSGRTIRNNVPNPIGQNKHDFIYMKYMYFKEIKEHRP